jgi:hypothetical protein
LVGFIWDLIQEVVQGIIAALFKAIGIELPSFELPLGFVDDVLDDIKDAVNKLDSVIDHFANIIDLDGELFDRIEQVVDDFTDLLPDSLLDFTNCDEHIEQCIEDKFGVRLLDEGAIPGIRVDSVDYTVPEEFVDLVQDVLDGIGEMKDMFEELLDGGIECGEYKTVHINVLEYLETTHGFNTSKLGIPACPTSFQMCTDIQMPGAEDFIGKVKKVLKLDGGRRRRMAETCAGDGGGMSIPLTLPTKLLKILSAKFMPMNIDSKVRGKHTELQKMWQKGKTAQIAKLSEKSKKRLDWVSGPFYMKTFEFSTKLVIGCEKEDFAMKLQIAPFFNLGVHIQSPYILTRLGKASLKKLKDVDVYKKEQGKTVEVLAEIICHLDYILATVKAITGDGYFERMFSDEMIDQYLGPDLKAFDYLLKPLYVNRKEFISKMLSLSDAYKLEGEDIIEDLGTAIKETFEPLRVDTENVYSRHSSSAEGNRGSRGDGSTFWRQAHPDGGACSGPPSIKGLLLGDGDPAEGLLYFLKGFGWNPLKYGT